MTAKCLMCGDDIILLCDGHFELSMNRYVCIKCVAKVEEEQLRDLLEKKLAAKNDAADAAKRLGEVIKEHLVTVGEANAKD